MLLIIPVKFVPVLQGTGFLATVLNFRGLLHIIASIKFQNFLVSEFPRYF